MPGAPQRPLSTRQCGEPALVAEPAEPEHPAPELAASDPMGEDFDYAEEFKTLDLDAVKADLTR